MELRELRLQFEWESEGAVAAVHLIERLMELDGLNQRTTSQACECAVRTLTQHVRNLSSIAGQFEVATEEFVAPSRPLA